ncbi:aminopeptidase N-like isoform X2 [Toxorhynchites rutilus septentrionalis]|uniref:aminopeptidase N-like isoform X2 n=2 Tax=Toxorhynchites rutilus septentrionalis TaxID=329112 RepID=UPI002478AE5A|nr:aminopeptidase N-like isoform X2 [Toxorhynchites rutilus septentrionalis]
MIFCSLLLIVANAFKGIIGLDNRSIMRRISEPLSYNVFLDISSESYKGNVEIELRYLDMSNFIYLISKGVSIQQSSVKMTKPNGENLPLRNIGMDHFDQMYFGFEEKLRYNETYKLYIEFSNTIGTDRKGLYRSNYSIGQSKRHIAVTHFKPSYARMVFPCYDEPSYKALFNISIRHRSEFHALSNMPTREITIEDGNFTVTRFETTPLMPTYTLAFVVSDYSGTTSDEDTRIKVFVPEHQIQYTPYVLNFAAKSLKCLENFLEQPFHLSKVDIVAIPEANTAAMEGWGLITAWSDLLLYNAETTTARTKQRIANLISHQFVHSWFGNAVTPEWWTYLWMSEGFSRYFGYFVTDQIEDTWQLWDQFVVNNVHWALSQDDKSNTRAMNHNPTGSAVLEDLFDYVVYEKSASVIRMMQHVFGLDTLKASLIEFIANSGYQITKPEHLYRYIEKHNKVNLPGTVEEIFSSWTNNPGYPLVTVIQDGTHITFSQKRFWTPVEGEKYPNNVTYFVPLTYTFSSELKSNSSQQNDWLTPNLTEIVKEVADVDSWILVNIQQVGYYRVNYDNGNWAALSAVLNSDEMNIIPVINRAQLIDDVTSLARAGETDYKIALSLMNYLKQELEYIPWSTAYNAVMFLDRMFSGNEQYSSFENFIRTLTERVYGKNRMADSNDHVSRLHRENISYLSCFFGLKDCVDDAKQLADRMLTDESYVPHAELQAAIFCSISKYAPSKQDNLLQIIYERYLSMSETDDALIDRYIAGMSCTTDVATINSLLKVSVNYSQDSNLTNHEKNQILIGLVRSSHNGLREGLNFLLEYYADVSYMNAPLEEIFGEFGNRVNTNETYELLKQVVEKYQNIFSDSIAASANQSLVNSAKNIAWVAKYAKEISNWLVANDYTPTSTTPNPPTSTGTSSIAINFVGIVLFVCLMHLS